MSFHPPEPYLYAALKTRSVSAEAALENDWKMGLELTP
jgi:hypothetical protein